MRLYDLAQQDVLDGATHVAGEPVGAAGTQVNDDGGQVMEHGGGLWLMSNGSMIDGAGPGCQENPKGFGGWWRRRRCFPGSAADDLMLKRATGLFMGSVAQVGAGRVSICTWMEGAIVWGCVTRCGGGYEPGRGGGWLWAGGGEAGNWG
ncbi:MAG: hypothetical protein AAF787_19885 [Chloroflexota bacterium]